MMNEGCFARAGVDTHLPPYLLRVCTYLFDVFPPENKTSCEFDKREDLDTDCMLCDSSWPDPPLFSFPFLCPLLLALISAF